MSSYTTFTFGFLAGLIIAFIGLAWLKAKHQVLEARIKTLQENLHSNQVTLETQQKQSITRIKTIATLEAEKTSLEKNLAAHQEKDKERAEKLSLQFNKLANELLKQGSEKLVIENKTQIESLLVPLKEKIIAFEKQITRTHEETLARNIALRTELKKIEELNLQITQEAKNLANAIKGDNKMQGNWGEFILERLLEDSGLEKDREYIIQESFITSEGKRYRPDVVVKLPDEKNIVIDAKVSLVHYEKCCNAEDPQEQKIYAKKHVQSIKTHIKDLSKKNYAQEYDLKGLDFVLMFIPIEPAYLLAVKHEPGLFQEAYEKNIVLVTPSTLMGLLRMIEHTWKTENQNKNALEIARRSGDLFDKFVSFTENIKKIGSQLNTTQKTYETAIKQLSEGKGNLIDKVQRLKLLGARTNKTLRS